MKVSIGNPNTPKVIDGIKSFTDPEIQKNDIKLPNNIIADHIVIDIKTEVARLLLADEKIFHNLNISKIMEDFDRLVSPIIGKFILKALNLEDNSKNDICSDLTEIIYYYIKIEYYMYSLDIKEIFVKNHISNAVFAAIHKERA